jgi:16S rRNA (guanine966-N2)-methyltransferase
VSGKIRIIGGSWRSRKIDVIDSPGLRPTPDRVRETLFNWLQPYIQGAICLDLYAGTGILGLEALSRGASSLVMVEYNSSLTKNLHRQVKKLDAKQVKIENMDVCLWLKQSHEPFDIIFMDPPYANKQVGNNVKQLINFGCVKHGSLLYIESGEEIEDLDPRLELMKSAKAGIVQHRLFRFL